MRTILKHLLKRIGKVMLPPIQAVDYRSTPSVKAHQVLLFNYWRGLYISKNSLPKLTEVGFRNFSQFEEDGLLLYIFSLIGMGEKRFIDIGCADGINSNCANLLINWGWHGLFIDGNERLINNGRVFYSKHPDTWAYPPIFINSIVQVENINTLISSSGIIGDIELLSIDIDGNDYWVWKNIDVIQPKVVIIETHVEFGFNSVVVPYDKDYMYPGIHPDYHGASPVAMEKLARSKGYRLIGANAYGFNLIFMRNDIGLDCLPEVKVEDVLKHPRNKERYKLFEPIKHFKYIEV